jgi:urease accessory protein
VAGCNSDRFASVLHLVNAPIIAPDPSRSEVAVRTDRITLAKRRWRGFAEDGVEFGLELAAPLTDGETILQTSTVRYVIRQEPEAVVEILLDLAPSAAAGIGWAIGNLHLELCGEPTRLLAPDEPAVKRLLERLNVAYRPTTAVFRPGRFARGNLPTHELGTSHTH